jgi:dihydrofolate reductase
MWEAIGATVMGRHLFDLVNGWEGSPPAGDHVVVVSHRPKPEGWHPPTILSRTCPLLSPWHRTWQATERSA